MDKKAKSPVKEQEKQKTEEGVETELKECQKLRGEYLAGWQRAKADYLNYKKDEAERNKKERHFTEMNCLLSFLSIYESLKAAAKHGKDQDIKQIIKQFENVLASYNVKKIDAMDKQFDPELHEAVEYIESDKEKGIIIEVLREGYLYQDKLLIPTKVKVSKGPKKEVKN